MHTRSHPHPPTPPTRTRRLTLHTTYVPHIAVCTYLLTLTLTLFTVGAATVRAPSVCPLAWVLVWLGWCVVWVGALHLAIARARHSDSDLYYRACGRVFSGWVIDWIDRLIDRYASPILNLFLQESLVDRIVLITDSRSVARWLCRTGEAVCMWSGRLHYTTLRRRRR